MAATTATTNAEVKDLKTEYPHIVRRPGMVGGRPRIAGTRLPVWQIALSSQKGATVEQIVETYHPDITPAAVHSALAYYWDHKAEVDAEIEENRPENVMAELRRDPNWIEEQPGRFRYKPPEQVTAR
ncbi:MAG: DUF433 domain-containing protein [Chloroflexota bacterium]